MRIERSVKPRRVVWRDESGAISVLVALITVFVLLGLTVLAVDGGNLFMQRRRIVGATDAATIAAAQWCVQSLAGTATDTITDHADQTATGSVLLPDPAIRSGTLLFSSSKNGPWVTTQCLGSPPASKGYVKATYGVKAPQGFIVNNRQVHATAIAVWGAAGGGTGTMPMALQEARLSNCGIQPPIFPPVGTKCAFWTDNNDVGNASWGWANMTPGSGWNVAKNAGCSGVGASDLGNWMGGSAPQLTLNYPEPTYVCIVPGLKTSDMQTMATLVGRTLQFPINDPCHLTPPGPSGAIHGQVTSSGALICPPGTPDKWDIVGFAQLKLTAVQRGNQGGIAACTPPIGQPGGPAGSANGYCVTATWLGFQTGGIDPGGGGNFGEEAIGLGG